MKPESANWRDLAHLAFLIAALLVAFIAGSLLLANPQVVQAQTPPDFTWAQGAGGFGFDFGYGLATTPAGDSVITGEFSDTAIFGGQTLVSTTGSDIFIAKYDRSGQVLWAESAGGPLSGGSDKGRGIAIDALNHHIITGEFSGTAIFGTTQLVGASLDLFLAKYDESGQVLWAEQAGGSGLDIGTAVATDTSNNIFITGHFTGTASFGSATTTSAGQNDVFIAKYDANGNLDWLQQAGGPQSDVGLSLATGPLGNVYVTGNFQGTASFGAQTLTSAGGDDIFVAKYDANGNLVWVQSFGAANTDHGTSLATDLSGNVLLTGEFQDSVTFGSQTLNSVGKSDIFIAKLDSNGAVLWARQGGGSEQDIGQSLVTDAASNVLVTGFFQKIANFGTQTLTSLGSTDIFVAQYDELGNLVWLQQAGGSDQSVGRSLAADGSGGALLTGEFQSQATFGTTTLTSGGTNDTDIFVAKLGGDPVSPREPVIIIPGITGSWNWDVLINDNTNSQESWQFPPFSNVYEPFLEALKAQGYVEGETLFIAFYDWRSPNVLAATQYLKPIIDDAKQASGSAKVDIIAHSMGGILARSYIQGSNYENDVDQLLMLGTPNQGSSDVYSLWEGGRIPENWNIVQRIAFSAFFVLNKAFTQNQVYNFVHTDILSLRDLLPTYDYLRDKNTGTLKQTSALQEQNTTLNVLNNSINDLNTLTGGVITIGGTEVATVGEIPFIDRNPGEEPFWVDGKPEPLDPARNDSAGDDRVLLSSAHIQAILDQETLSDAKHGDLVSKGANLVFDRLGLEDPGTLALVEEPEEILSFFFASPVAPTVTDPLGNQISAASSTIPDAIYFGEADPSGMKMILIPAPVAGEYQVDLVGTASGSYDFTSAFFKENFQDSIQIFSGQVATGTEVLYSSELNPNDPNNSLFTEIVDEGPPVTVFSSPLPGEVFEHHEIISLNASVVDISTPLKATSTIDQASNVAHFSTTTSLTIQRTQDLPLLALGLHTFGVVAEDLFNNTSSTSTSFSIIATPDSFPEMLQYGLGNGWFIGEIGRHKAQELIYHWQEALHYGLFTRPDARLRLREFLRNTAATLTNLVQHERLTEQGYQVLIGDLDYIFDQIFGKDS